jgi:sporulation protein YlmC with PRC-barrel domain
MHLELDCPVRCTDGPFGELADVVIDPIRRRVTHLVVEPHHRHRLARLVPVELASAQEGAGRAIALGCTIDDAHRLPPVEEFAYVRFGELAVEDPDWDVGIENVLALPFFADGNVMDLDPHVGVTYDRIPTGEVEIRRTSDVFSADGRRIGHVDGFLVDGHDAITHVVLGKRHLFGRRELIVPVAAVARVKTDSVELDLTKDELRRLAAAPASVRAG